MKTFQEFLVVKHPEAIEEGWFKNAVAGGLIGAAALGTGAAAFQAGRNAAPAPQQSVVQTDVFGRKIHQKQTSNMDRLKQMAAQRGDSGGSANFQHNQTNNYQGNNSGVQPPNPNQKINPEIDDFLH